MLGSLLALAALSPTADARPPQRRPAVRHVRPSPRVSPRVVVRVGIREHGTSGKGEIERGGGEGERVWNQVAVPGNNNS